ncbi:PPK2 family polyphosphate kinase [Nesterenkonia haasae]|uniref:PPK2 family polyphosphate kinase n=1 Tax=Nesterenkonia haasae TaxID=2587813 RepID=UPI001F1798C6|nr:PPK2 family polyphosphate kinase [Nesterenkonia haasae]
MPANSEPLNVNLSGVPGPDTSGNPLAVDPRSLWRVRQFDSPLDLSAVPTRRRAGFDAGKKAGKEALMERGELLADLQELLWAHEFAAPEAEREAVVQGIAARAPESAQDATRRKELFGPRVQKLFDELEPGPRVLLVLQGMDASGKGGMVKSVVSMMDPLGVEVTAFGKPTEQERQEHFLERIIRRLPRPGHVGVFDRSHYEDVLVPAVTGTHDADELAERVETLQHFESELVRHGFVIVKVMLHVSAAEQLDRLVARLDRIHKHWKYDPSDADARAEFGRFQTVYASLLEATDAVYAPWHVVGADRKWYARLVVQEVLITALADLNLRWPAADYDIETERRRLMES